MMRLQWLSDALDDLKRLHAFIEPHSAAAAKRTMSTLVAASESLLDFPENGKPWDENMDFRELAVPFGARSYVIRYRLLQEQIIIVRIWHALEER